MQSVFIFCDLIFLFFLLSNQSSAYYASIVIFIIIIHHLPLRIFLYVSTLFLEKNYKYNFCYYYYDWISLILANQLWFCSCFSVEEIRHLIGRFTLGLSKPPCLRVLCLYTYLLLFSEIFYRGKSEEEGVAHKLVQLIYCTLYL